MNWNWSKDGMVPGPWGPTGFRLGVFCVYVYSVFTYISLAMLPMTVNYDTCAYQLIG